MCTNVLAVLYISGDSVKSGATSCFGEVSSAASGILPAPCFVVQFVNIICIVASMLRCIGLRPT